MIDTLMAVAGAIILYIQNSKLFFITIIMIVLYAVIVLGFNNGMKNLIEKKWKIMPSLRLIWSSLLMEYRL